MSDLLTPSWIVPEEECMWCNRFSLNPQKIKASKNYVLITYVCDNLQCEHLKRYDFEAIFHIKMNGTHFVENYKNFVKGKDCSDLFTKV